MFKQVFRILRLLFFNTETDLNQVIDNHPMYKILFPHLPSTDQWILPAVAEW